MGYLCCEFVFIFDLVNFFKNRFFFSFTFGIMELNMWTHKLITLFSNLVRSRKQSRSLILVKLCGDFVRERSTIQRNLRAELPLATRFRERICSPPRRIRVSGEGRERGDSGSQERGWGGTGKQKLEHASAVPFNLRGNIFGVRWLSSVFYKVVTKVALIFTLAASFWQNAH